MLLQSNESNAHTLATGWQAPPQRVLPFGKRQKTHHLPMQTYQNEKPQFSYFAQAQQPVPRQTSRGSTALSWRANNATLSGPGEHVTYYHPTRSSGQGTTASDEAFTAAQLPVGAPLQLPSKLTEGNVIAPFDPTLRMPSAAASLQQLSSSSSSTSSCSLLSKLANLPSANIANPVHAPPPVVPTRRSVISPPMIPFASSSTNAGQREGSTNNPFGRYQPPHSRRGQNNKSRRRQTRNAQANNNNNNVQRTTRTNNMRNRAMRRQTNNNMQARGQNNKAQPHHYDDDEGYLVYRHGDNLTQRYKILKTVGEGTFGKVVEAFDRVTRQRVAIKVVKALKNYTRAARTEIEILEYLNNQSDAPTSTFVQLLSSFTYRRHKCLVFPLHSMDLYKFSRSFYRNKGLPFELIQSIGYSLLEAVDFFHRHQLIHTDLKPENILFTNELTYQTKVIDLGSAVWTDDFLPEIVTTRHYRAPEVVLGANYSLPIDMWSVGCILVELLTSKVLFVAHDDLEHLAMIEKVTGAEQLVASNGHGVWPDHIINSASSAKRQALFRSNFPGANQTPLKTPPPQVLAKHSAYSKLRALWPLMCDAAKRRRHGVNNPAMSQLHQLIVRCLQIDPTYRITAQEALNHPFFQLDLSNGNKGGTPTSHGTSTKQKEW
mmetsp:Transcript_19233/g.28641  ORF Transcript_19233/g.28641 Transcript_19233/m.28641 type:complete len:658 (+) Transcript_19233:167-2140(+)|eukprot:CAMPEP_0201552604 /NCGR_PEP_ID=MMETSP0173_2-20130828/16806_1 /ASSEMBLY_ACC=CAM_ASM_000268 /TAXON_ID=218659 /ORGANISM="Vexillifera sp., Strain DIVA3 564/2" /LENGTH=657 /DNA_ID=CAMNT_0047963105 /DNA_START=157 /DNA_END=2130 /DNA_ORIENTATION=+